MPTALQNELAAGIGANPMPFSTSQDLEQEIPQTASPINTTMLQQVLSSQPQIPTHSSQTSFTKGLKDETGTTATRMQAVDPNELNQVTEMVENIPSVRQQKDAIAQQETALKNLLDVEKNVPTWSKLDLTMSLAFVDEMYGTKLVKSYRPYSSPEGAITKLQSSILEQTGRLNAQKEKLYGNLLKNKEQEKDLSTATTQNMQGTRDGMGSANPLDTFLKLQMLNNRNEDRNRTALKDANAIIKPAENLRILGKLGTLKSDAATIYNTFGRLPETGDESILELMPESTKKAVTGIEAYYKNTLGTPEEKEYQKQRVNFLSNKKELSSMITQYYSGAAATDAEQERMFNILGGKQVVTPEAYIENLDKFEKEFSNDIKMRYAVVMADPSMARAVSEVKAGDISKLNEMLNAAKTKVKSNIQSGEAKAPVTSSGLSDADIDAMLEE